VLDGSIIPSPESDGFDVLCTISSAQKRVWSPAALTYILRRSESDHKFSDLSLDIQYDVQHVIGGLASHLFRPGTAWPDIVKCAMYFWVLHRHLSGATSLLTPLLPPLPEKFAFRIISCRRQEDLSPALKKCHQPRDSPTVLIVYCEFSDFKVYDILVAVVLAESTPLLWGYQCNAGLLPDKDAFDGFTVANSIVLRSLDNDSAIANASSRMFFFGASFSFLFFSRLL
jgi:hypothetical protein